MLFDRLTLSQIVAENVKRKKKASNQDLSITIFSNITVLAIDDLLTYFFLQHNVLPKIKFATHDNFLQEIVKDKSFDIGVLFWELSNLIPNSPSAIEEMSDEEFRNLAEAKTREISLFLREAANCPLLIFNKFSDLPFSCSSHGRSRSRTLQEVLNDHIEKNKTAGTVIIDIERVIAQLGVQSAYTFKHFKMKKILYTTNFLKAYIQSIQATLNKVVGKNKKALILDCDNTLWHGVLGEDGFDGIDLSPESATGCYFNDVQEYVRSLGKRGIILGLCTKNNAHEIERVLDRHPDMVLKSDDFVVVKSNWKNKAQNLIDISNELNIGLDSIVFVDDSLFELDLVSGRLPEVTCLQVPSDIYRYPSVLRETVSCLFTFNGTSEDKERGQFYKDEQQRRAQLEEFKDIDDFLMTLEIILSISENNANDVHRIAQMTQRTNQFNLTSRRYTESQIAQFQGCEFQGSVFSCSVSDRFGNSGTTGLVIVHWNRDEGSADIDTFLISCRIMGRKIEYAIMDFLLNRAAKEGLTRVRASFAPSGRNEPASKFLVEAGFKPCPPGIDGYEFVQASNLEYRKTIQFVETIIQKEEEHV
jgi:FkbH-like protein